MGKNLHIVFFFFFASSLQVLLAQSLYIEQSKASISGHSEQDLAAVLRIANYGKQPIELQWSRAPDMVPGGWETWVCDRNCQRSAAQSNRFTLYPGEQISDFRVVFRPNGQPGTGSVSLMLKSSDPTDAPQRLSFSAQASPNQSLSSLSSRHNMDQAKVYPNPATEFISVQSQGQDIKRVEVYNALGRPVASFKLQYEGERLDISRLHRGMYMVRLIDSQGRIIRTQSISKNNP